MEVVKGGVNLMFWFRARVEKYRPVTLDDVVSHKEITGTSTLHFL